MDIRTEAKRYLRPLTIYPWRAAWAARRRGLLAAGEAWLEDIIQIGQ